MNNKIKFSLIVTFVVLIFATACNKYPQMVVNDKQVHYKSLEEMNSINPTEKQIFKLYHRFHDDYQKFTLKELDTSNLQADTAIWQFETSINTDYGFPFDVARKKFDNYDTTEYSITGYTTDSVPIIDGSELYSYYSAKVNDIQAENNDGDSTYFWCTRLNIYSIDKSRQKVIVTAMFSYATPYPHILPPGVYPDPFPDPMCLSGDQAAPAFESKYEITGPSINYPGTTQWVITLYEHVTYSHHDPDVGDQLWWRYYSVGTLCTYPYGDGSLNNYLYSTKDVIDDHNYSHDNIFLGNLDINDVYVTYTGNQAPEWEHIVHMFFYEIHDEASQN